MRAHKFERDKHKVVSPERWEKLIKYKLFKKDLLKSESYFLPELCLAISCKTTKLRYTREMKSKLKSLFSKFQFRITSSIWLLVQGLQAADEDFAIPVMKEYRSQMFDFSYFWRTRRCSFGDARYRPLLLRPALTTDSNEFKANFSRQRPTKLQCRQQVVEKTMKRAEEMKAWGRCDRIRAAGSEFECQHECEQWRP